MLFVEAIRRYSQELKEVHLDEAYKLALPIFKGRLEQTFIVLKDNVSDRVTTGANEVPLGAKRVATDELAPLGSKRHAN